jgi:hypothetical protein
LICQASISGDCPADLLCSLFVRHDPANLPEGTLMSSLLFPGVVVGLVQTTLLNNYGDALVTSVHLDECPVLILADTQGHEQIWSQDSSPGHPRELPPAAGLSLNGDHIEETTARGSSDVDHQLSNGQGVVEEPHSRFVVAPPWSIVSQDPLADRSKAKHCASRPSSHAADAPFQSHQ